MAQPNPLQSQPMNLNADDPSLGGAERFAHPESGRGGRVVVVSPGKALAIAVELAGEDVGQPWPVEHLLTLSPAAVQRMVSDASVRVVIIAGEAKAECESLIRVFRQAREDTWLWVSQRDGQGGAGQTNDGQADNGEAGDQQTAEGATSRPDTLSPDALLLEPIDSRSLGKRLKQAMAEQRKATPTPSSPPSSFSWPAPAASIERAAMASEQKDDLASEETRDSHAEGGAVESEAVPTASLDEHQVEPSSGAPPQARPSAMTDADRLRTIDEHLLSRLLATDGSVRESAMAFVAKTASLNGMGWTQPGEAAPADRVGLPLLHRGQSIGALHLANEAEATRVKPWLTWLTRWVALERQNEQLWFMALRDELTGAWNRRYFNRFLRQKLREAATGRFQVTLLLFDIDDFKKYNDTYGHAAGDEILTETVKLMTSLVREHDVVARIGGDEFAVVFWDADESQGAGQATDSGNPRSDARHTHAKHPADVRAITDRFQRAIREKRYPKLLGEALGTLTISGGLASFPWDGRSPEELIEIADTMAGEGKQRGKGQIILGPGAMRDG